MAIVKKGTLTVTTGGAAQNLNLGFIPSYFRMVNKTKIAATTNGVVIAEWYDDMASATANIWTTSAGDGTNKITRQGTNGVTLLQTASPAEYTSTSRTITAITKAANAQVTVTSHGLVVGDVVTFHSVVGMLQINTLSGIVQSVVDANNFTVNINSVNFTTYVSGGVANLISGTTRNAGVIGLTLGSALMVTTSDVWEYVAMLDAPFTS